MTTFPDPDDQRVEQGRTLTGLLPGGARLTILSDLDRVDSFDAAAIAFLSLSLGVLLLVALLGSLSMEAAVASRLRAFSLTAEAIITGNLRERVPLSQRGDEFDRLAATINLMLDRIGELFGEVRRLSGYVAHDLRTPLVRLSGALREESRACGSTESCSAALSRAARECDRLLELVGAILQLGQIDRFEVRARGADFDLSDMLGDLSEAHEAVVEASGRLLRVSIEAGVQVCGMRDLLAQAFTNLLDNAIEHTAPGTTIRVALAQGQGIAQLVVADDSPLGGEDPAALLADDRASVRANAGQNRTALGLKLVRAVVHAHRGTLRLSRLDPGLKVEIDLPLVERGTPSS